LIRADLAGAFADLAEAGAGERRAAVARELTKQFEEIRRGTVSELAQYYAGGAPRGEVVVLLEGAVHAEPDEAVQHEPDAAQDDDRREHGRGLPGR